MTRHRPSTLESPFHWHERQRRCSYTHRLSVDMLAPSASMESRSNSNCGVCATETGARLQRGNRFCTFHHPLRVVAVPSAGTRNRTSCGICNVNSISCTSTTCLLYFRARIDLQALHIGREFFASAHSGLCCQLFFIVATCCFLSETFRSVASSLNCDRREIFHRVAVRPRLSPARQSLRALAPSPLPVRRTPARFAAHLFARFARPIWLRSSGTQYLESSVCTITCPGSSAGLRSL